jgi:hypothetical protein
MATIYVATHVVAEPGIMDSAAPRRRRGRRRRRPRRLVCGDGAVSPSARAADSSHRDQFPTTRSASPSCARMLLTIMNAPCGLGPRSAGDSDVAKGPTVRPTVRANSLKLNAADGADGADANSARQSGKRRRARRRQMHGETSGEGRVAASRCGAGAEARRSSMSDLKGKVAVV